MTTSYKLYDFLSGCGGNWRNAIFLSCASCAHPCQSGGRGYLLTTESVGKPLLVSINDFEKLTGQQVDTEECIGHLSRGAFEAMYFKHLLWSLDSAAACPLSKLALQVQSYPK